MKVINGDSLEELKKLDSESIEALITDPPYGLSKMTTENIQECLTNWLAGKEYNHKEKGFMNKKWDSFVPSPELWKEVYRVMKHGAHGLVFAGTRTQDLMSISLRLAGFEVKDTLMWVYGSGFPCGNLNISKAIDKKLGLERKVVGKQKMTGTARKVKGTSTNTQNLNMANDYEYEETYIDITEPASDDAKKYNGWGTRLKPAYEPILLIKKPTKNKIVDNVLNTGCGAINIDATRIETSDDLARVNNQDNGMFSVGNGRNKAQIHKDMGLPKLGRWPANVMIDDHIDHEDMKRYFFTSKASKKEREAGLSHIDSKRANIHPTVKPLDLMRYLVKLITPPNGTALDPFCGSGSTLCALALESMEGIGIELSKEYCEIAEARIKHWEAERKSRLL